MVILYYSIRIEWQVLKTIQYMTFSNQSFACVMFSYLKLLGLLELYF